MNYTGLVITVITVVYNDESHIEMTINSVLEQDYPYVDYVIIDGKSSDMTLDIIRNYSSQIRLISEPDSGIYNAMNKGLRIASGEYVIFMNSGDRFSDSRTISEIVKYIDYRKTRPVMVYGNYREITNGSISTVIPARSFKKIWYGAFASHQSIFYNRLFLLKHNLFYDESYRIAADYKLNLEVVARSNGNILQTPVCVSDFDMSGVSTVNQNLGLTEADRARSEVLHMNGVCRRLIIGVQLCARFAKKNMGFVYKIIRFS